MRFAAALFDALEALASHLKVHPDASDETRATNVYLAEVSDLQVTARLTTSGGARTPSLWHDCKRVAFSRVTPRTRRAFDFSQVFLGNDHREAFPHRERRHGRFPSAPPPIRFGPTRLPHPVERQSRARCGGFGPQMPMGRPENRGVSIFSQGLPAMDPRRSAWHLEHDQGRLPRSRGGGAPEVGAEMQSHGTGRATTPHPWHSSLSHPTRATSPARRRTGGQAARTATRPDQSSASCRGAADGDGPGAAGAFSRAG